MHRLKSSVNHVLLITFSLSVIFSFKSYSALKFSNLDSEIKLPESTINNPNIPIQQPAYTVVEIMPQFPGGEGALFTFIKQNIHYPEEAYKNKIQGKVVVQLSSMKLEKLKMQKW